MAFGKRFNHSSGLLPALLLLTTGCADYSISVNEQPMYNPPVLFTDFQLADAALETCVQQTIEDQQVTRAGELTRLNCSSAGIESLEGLSRFAGLKAVNLDDNGIADISPLETLSRLEVLQLKNNRISSAEPLLALLQMRELDLRGNEALKCGDARQLTEQSEAEVRLPEHCRQ